MSLKNKHYAVELIPLDIEDNMQVLQNAIRGRSASMVQKFKGVGFKPVLMLCLDTSASTVEDGLADIGKADVSFGKEIMKKVVDNEQYTSTIHPFVIHTELKMANKALIETAVTDSPSVVVNVGNHVVPKACTECDYSEAILSELTKDDHVIDALESQMHTMQNNIAMMFTKMNPDVDFEYCTGSPFKELPVKAVLDVWFAKLKRATTIESFNTILHDTDSLEPFKNISKGDVKEFATTVSNMYMHASELLSLLEIVSSPDSEDGEGISLEEKKLITPCLTALRGDVQDITKQIKNKSS